MVSCLLDAKRRRLECVGVFLGCLALLLWRMPDLAHFLQNSDHGYQLALGRLVTCPIGFDDRLDRGSAVR